MGVVSFFAGVCLVPLGAGRQTQKIDGSLPLTGRQPKLDEIPGGDQMPGGFCDSVAPQRQILSRPIGQQRGSSPKGAGAFLVTFCANKKSPGSGPGRPGSQMHPPGWREACSLQPLQLIQPQPGHSIRRHPPRRRKLRIPPPAAGAAGVARSAAPPLPTQTALHPAGAALGLCGGPATGGRELKVYSSSNSSSHNWATASLGIRQSPRGLRATEPTLGPSGRQERLNC